MLPLILQLDWYGHSWYPHNQDLQSLRPCFGVALLLTNFLSWAFWDWLLSFSKSWNPQAWVLNKLFLWRWIFPWLPVLVSQWGVKFWYSWPELVFVDRNTIFFWCNCWWGRISKHLGIFPFISSDALLWIAAEVMRNSLLAESVTLLNWFICCRSVFKLSSTISAQWSSSECWEYFHRTWPLTPKSPHSPQLIPIIQLLPSR